MSVKGLNITAHSWGMTNTWEGHAYVSSDGHACPVNIRTAGHGKYSFGKNRIYSDKYPEGVYRVDINTGEIDITYFPPEGGVKKLRPVLAPEPVQKFARVFAEEANCYHCKCLQHHLDVASRAAQEETTPGLTA